jgi:hypothetical protein
MSFLEPLTICSAQEYDSKRSARQSFAEQKPDDLGVLMVRLRSPIKEAAKIPVRINEVKRDSGAAICSIAFLNSKLEEVHNSEYEVRDDILIVGAILRVTHDKVKYPTLEAYLVDYFDDMMPPSFRMNTALSLA